jgi:hypothetical protein
VSNPDKHRTLPFLTSQESFRHAVFDPADGMVTGQLVASIRFDHADINVMGGMKFIRERTTELVEAFAPGFVPYRIPPAAGSPRPS